MGNFQRISTTQAKQLIAQGDIAIVDVRDGQSYHNGHIDQAILLDNSSVNQFIASTEKSTPVLVYCYHGNSSQNAAQFLFEQGFAEVYSMDGGFEAWRQQD
ncbi:thiosulfate sulfurtransferase GlpE [Oceanicoccus sp. KOV_DT_Chl]|uniref:thiosulfate sulfurtransferase GlpE n=1 Tax=Oceanicoccus sp. KOV_DT_Chl TaxID=1904639 RepID=UPI000C7BF6A2|nr:thiosulfate sulfurtransferase GlpE [Oceanicoccus sp. KOV_DT_Chl]